MQDSRSIIWIFIHIISLVALCYFIFQNSLENDFSFDDHLAILNNKDTQVDLTSHISLWRHDCWGKDLSMIDSHRSYRPLLVLIFRYLRYNYGMNPRIFRYVSITSHFLTSILVYILGNILLGNQYLAYASSLLFMAHPVHVESVVSVVNMAEPISCFFFIMAFLLYWFSTRDKIGTNRILSIFQTLTSLISCIVCIICSFLIKETGITLTAMIVASSGIQLVHQLFHTTPKSPLMKTMISWLHIHFVWIIMCLSVLVAYSSYRLVLTSMNPIEVVMKDGFNHFFQQAKIIIFSPNSRKSVFLEKSELIRRAENPYAFLEGQEKMLSMAYLHFRYMYLLLWPHPLSAEYSYDCIPKISVVTDYRNLFSIFSYFSIVVAIFIGFIQVFYIPPPVSTSHQQPPLTQIQPQTQPLIQPQIPAKDATTSSKWRVNGSAILHIFAWLLITFIPASGIFLRLGTLLAERLMYTPSVSFALFVPILIYKLVSFLFQKNILLSKMIFWLCILSLTGLYSHLTIHRNKAWKNDEILFKEALQTCPRSAKLNLMNAKHYIHKNNTQADIYTKAALEIDPEHCDSKLLEAQLDILLRNDIELAVLTAADGLKCKFIMEGIWTFLNQLFQVKLQAKPNDPSVLEYIADIYVRAGVSLIAAKTYQDAALMYFNQGKYVEAIRTSVKVENEIPHFLLPDEDTSSQLDKIHEISCHIYMLGGSLRYYISSLGAEEQKKKKLKMTKRLRKELTRAKEMLYKAILPDCSAINPATKTISYAHSVSAIPHLTSLLKAEFHAKTSLETSTELLLATEYSIASLVKVIPYAIGTDLTSYQSMLQSMLADAIQLTALIGRSQWKSSKYTEATAMLRKSVWYMSSEFSRVKCSDAHYWLANSLAMDPDFTQNNALLREAADALERVVYCDSEGGVVDRMKQPALVSLRDIHLFLKENEELQYIISAEGQI